MMTLPRAVQRLHTRLRDCVTLAMLAECIRDVAHGKPISTYLQTAAAHCKSRGCAVSAAGALREPQSVTRHSRYVSLLQVCGTLAVMAFHMGVRGGWLWTAVVLFFALAGVNMAGTVEGSATVSEYGRSRLTRMAMPLVVVWSLVALMALAGTGTRGAAWFLMSSPVFMQNFTLRFFEYQFPQDWIFGPLWFLGALMQLQLLVFACRKVLVRSRPWLVVGTVVILGTAFRWLTAISLEGSGREMDIRSGIILYCLPFTHIEAITLGFLVGRGALASLGRALPIVAILTIGTGLLSAILAMPHEPLDTLGFGFPLHANYRHVWGYGVLAFAAAALCSPANPVAVRVRSMTVPLWLESGLTRIASLTYGAYVFHGAVLASTAPLARWLTLHAVHPTRLIVFMVVVVGSFSLAMICLPRMRALSACRFGAPEWRR